MITLNDVTKRMDGKTFNTYSVSDLCDSIEELTAEEIAGLKERLGYLETVEKDDIPADGFGDEYEEFEGMDLFDEKLKLRSMFG